MHYTVIPKRSAPGVPSTTPTVPWADACVDGPVTRATSGTVFFWKVKGNHINPDYTVVRSAVARHFMYD